MTIASVETWVVLVIGLGFMQASPGPAVLTLVGYSFEFGKPIAVSLFVAFVLGQLTALVVGVMGVAVVLSNAPEVIDVLRFAAGCVLLYAGLSALVCKLKPTPPAFLEKIEYSPILTVDEEKYYIGLAQNGDQGARGKMVECNLQLLTRVAKPYLNMGLVPLTLNKESYFALIHSIEKFDIESEIPFSVYASWWIRHSIECTLMMQTRTILHQETKGITAENTLMSLKRLSGARYVHKSLLDVPLGQDVDPPSLDTLVHKDAWLMELEPQHHNVIVDHINLRESEPLKRKGIEYTPAVKARSRRHAVANTWFIAAGSPIAIVFYTAVFPNFFDVAGLDFKTLVFLGSAVLIISIATSAFYLLVTRFARDMVASSSIGKWISSLANVVLMMAGVWVIFSVLG